LLEKKSGVQFNNNFHLFEISRCLLSEWEAMSFKQRGISATDPLHGHARLDSSLLGLYHFGTSLKVLINSLETVHKTSRPVVPKSVRTVSNGKRVVKVFPRGLTEFLEMLDIKGEVVLSESKGEEDDLQESLDEASVGGVTVVLGAGNFDSPFDLLCQMFLKGKVGIYKPNPTNAATAPVYAKIMEPLISKGFLAFVEGGGSVGSLLVSHAAVDDVVLTGSVNTFNKIMWGSTPQEQEANQKANTPLLEKKICAELGAVTSWIYIPGDQWNKRSVDRHARHLVFSKLMNNGYVCASPQVFLVAENWKWRQEFLDRVRYWFGKHPGGAPFYPGSAESHSYFQSFQNAEMIRGRPGGNDEGSFPNHQWPILISNVTSENKQRNEILQREAWCPFLAEVPLPNDDNDPMQFLKSAVEFSEKKIKGSLSINIIINDYIMKKNDKSFEALITSIPYGIVGINMYPVYSHSMMKTTWGAFPGKDASGNGLVGNAWLFKNPEKSIIRAPFNSHGRIFTEFIKAKKASLLAPRVTTLRLRTGVASFAKAISSVIFGI